MVILPESGFRKLAANPAMVDFPEPELPTRAITSPDLASKLTKEPAGEKLNEFPEALVELTDLNILILRGNNLKTIPSSIGKLVNLKRLILTNNQLTTLPDEISELKNLKTLNMKGNNISPKEVSRIQSLLPDCKIKF